MRDNTRPNPKRMLGLQAKTCALPTVRFDMTIALSQGSEPLPGFHCVRLVGRSAQSETWLVRAPDESSRALKILFGGAELPHATKLTAYHHPFLMNWDRGEIQSGR